MDYAHKKCKHLKDAYDQCFKEFSDAGAVNITSGMFGNATNPCQDDFDDYRECVVVRINQLNESNKKLLPFRQL